MMYHECCCCLQVWSPIHTENLTGQFCRCGLADACDQTFNLKAEVLYCTATLTQFCPCCWPVHSLKVNWKPWETRLFEASWWDLRKDLSFSGIWTVSQKYEQYPRNMNRRWVSFSSFRLKGRSKIYEVQHFDLQSAWDQAMISIWAFNFSVSFLGLEILE